MKASAFTFILAAVAVGCSSTSNSAGLEGVGASQAAETSAVGTTVTAEIDRESCYVSQAIPGFPVGTQFIHDTIWTTKDGKPGPYTGYYILGNVRFPGTGRSPSSLQLVPSAPNTGVIPFYEWSDPTAGVACNSDNSACTATSNLVLVSDAMPPTPSELAAPPLQAPQVWTASYITSEKGELQTLLNFGGAVSCEMHVLDDEDECRAAVHQWNAFANTKNTHEAASAQPLPTFDKSAACR